MTEKKENNTGFIGRILGVIEKVGNKLPDPAILFFLCLIIVWILSWYLSDVEFTAMDPSQ